MQVKKWKYTISWIPEKGKEAFSYCNQRCEMV